MGRDAPQDCLRCPEDAPVGLHHPLGAARGPGGVDNGRQRFRVLDPILQLGASPGAASPRRNGRCRPRAAPRGSGRAPAATLESPRDPRRGRTSVDPNPGAAGAPRSRRVCAPCCPGCRWCRGVPAPGPGPVPPGRNRPTRRRCADSSLPGPPAAGPRAAVLVASVRRAGPCRTRCNRAKCRPHVVGTRLTPGSAAPVGGRARGGSVPSRSR